MGKNNDNAPSVSREDKKLHDPTLHQLKQWLLENRINGFSFSETALRLCPLHPTQFHVNAIKQSMFQTSSKMWFFPEQVAGTCVINQILRQVTLWTKTYNLFSIRALYERFRSEIPKLHSLEDFAAFFKVIAPEFDFTRGFWTSQAKQLDDLFRDLIGQIELDIFNKSEVTQAYIFALLPYLAQDEICELIQRYSSKLLAVSIGDTLCWKHVETLNLPDDFDIQLEDTINNLEKLGFALTTDHLILALCLAYKQDIRAESDLGDEDLFRFIITQYTGRGWKRKVLSNSGGSLSQPIPPDSTGALSFTLDDIPDLRFSSPVAIILNDKIIHVSRWTELVEKAVKEIYQGAPQNVLALRKQFSYLNDSGDGFWGKTKIDEMLWLERYGNSNTLVGRLSQLAKALGLDRAAIRINFRYNAAPQAQKGV